MLQCNITLRALAIFQQHGVTVHDYLFNYLWKNYGIRIDCYPVELISKDLITKYDIVINAACNHVFHFESLCEIEKICNELNLPMLNRPEALKRCSRVQFSKLMRDNGLHTARVERVSSLATLLATELRYPIILRKELSHLGSTMQFIASEHEAKQLPAELFTPETIAIEYFDFSNTEGLYRKHRCILLGDKVIPRHVISSPDWNIHSGSRQEERAIEHIAEDRAFWERDLKEAPALLTAKALAGLDYTIADYALTEAGEPFFFEMNPCFSAIDQRTFKREWAYQLEAVHEYCEAFAHYLYDLTGYQDRPTDYLSTPIVL